MTTIDEVFASVGCDDSGRVRLAARVEFALDRWRQWLSGPCRRACVRARYRLMRSRVAHSLSVYVYTCGVDGELAVAVSLYVPNAPHWDVQNFGGAIQVRVEAHATKLAERMTREIAKYYRIDRARTLSAIRREIVDRKR
jgi:hypothetical protein